MLDFLIWTSNNKLIRIPTTGAKFTWSNKRDTSYFIDRRLDRCNRNQLWFDSYNEILVSTTLNISSSIQGWLDIWRICSKSRKHQCKIISNVAIIHIFNSSWMANIMVRFKDNFFLNSLFHFLYPSCRL